MNDLYQTAVGAYIVVGIVLLGVGALGGTDKSGKDGLIYLGVTAAVAGLWPLAGVLAVGQHYYVKRTE